MDVSDAFNNNHSNTDTDNAGDKKLSEACWRHNKCIAAGFLSKVLTSFPISQKIVLFPSRSRNPVVKSLSNQVITPSFGPTIELKICITPFLVPSVRNMSVLVRSGYNDKKSKVSEYDLSFTRDLFEARLQSDSEDDYERDVDDGMSGDDDGRVDRAGDDDEGGDDRCRR
ncbi:hypothetical protein DY000_02015083 [Brassica cretica]|uniref:Uncharacterized protein n=1 Tax=Brassica cretica TaxID=69181 RepID=A0ABQ7CW76_BRACR|nr:hypothetical protein DY000_02015083 [Brassica cretica]